MAQEDTAVTEEDDTICQVCFEGWTEPTNQMLYCDSCNIAVHQGCYGITAVPDGDWFCAPCERGKKPLDTKCLLCPFYGGALRPVLDQWIHVSCVIWLPEIGYGDTEMLSVRNLNKVNPQRLGLRCSICETKHGACVQCSVKDCYTSMHVICAHSQGLLRMQTSLKDDVTMKQYCRKHAPPLPFEYSQTPDAERARAFAVMKHATSVETIRGQATADLNPEQILQTLHRLHAELAHQSRGGTNKRRRKADHTASRADQSGRVKNDAGAAPARKRMLSSYTLDGEGAQGAVTSDIAFTSSCSPGGMDKKQQILRSFGDDLLDDFVLPTKPRGRGSSGAHSGAKGDGFWATVEPYFVPFNIDLATRMLFGRSPEPSSAIQSYVQRLVRGREAATAFIGDPSTAHLTGAICGATTSATIAIDVADSRASCTSCPICAQVPRDAKRTGGMCSVCSTDTVNVSIDVGKSSVECVFQVGPSETHESSQSTHSLSGAQSAAVLALLNLCLQIDRRSLDSHESTAGTIPSAAEKTRCEVMSMLTSKVAAVTASLQATESCEVLSILRDFSWDGTSFVKPLDMWRLTKLTSHLVQFCVSAGVLTVDPNASGCAPAPESGDGQSDSAVCPSRPLIQLQSYNVTPERSSECLSEIETEAAALSIELAERCRANSTMAFSTWEKVNAARRRVGSGPHAAALGGTKTDSVASLQDYAELQRLEARTNETYRIRMNWHQMRNAVFRGTQDVDLEKVATGGDEDDSVCCICFDADSTEVNPIVFCEGCNIAVHKFCYGLPQVPEEDWFCKKCESPVQNVQEVVCQFCGIGDGALKRSSDGEWAHSFCSIWHPGISLRDATTTPIIKVPSEQKKQHAQASLVESTASAANTRCTICGQIKGPVKDCAHPGCKRKYHPMCAWYDGFLCHVYDSSKQQYEVDMDIYCDEHVPVSVKRDATAQKKWRNKDRADNSTKKRRGKKMSAEEKARQQRVRARSSAPDKYPDNICAVCHSPNPEHENAIIQCAGCKLYCHQACYGVTVVPAKGTWQCQTCEARLGQVECTLCPRTGGLFKPTTTGGWAHVTCALWIPESHVKDPMKMEPIVAKLTKQRQNLRCVLCGLRTGGCIQCAEKCYTAFHPICAFFAGYHMCMDEHEGAIRFRAFCKRHTDDMASEAARQAAVVMPPEFLQLQEMRRDLERLRLLAELVQRRETLKSETVRSRLHLMRQSLLAGVWPPSDTVPTQAILNMTGNDAASESDNEARVAERGQASSTRRRRVY